MSAKKSKPFLKMSPAECEAAVQKYDSGVSLEKTRPLTAKGMLLWDRARCERRSRRRKGVQPSSR